MNLFYVKPGDVQADRLTIKGQEASHITKVLRYQTGDEVWVTDGMGHLFKSKITGTTNQRVELRILSKKGEETGERRITLCMGIIKKRDRLEFAVEKAVELGVDQIIVFKGERSQKQNVRSDRLEATILSAMKQSLRVYLPEIMVASSLNQALEKVPKNPAIIIADENIEEQNKPETNNNIVAVVGPEGGFSTEEREDLIKRGGIAYSLGSKRLRTETAAITMVDRFKNILC